MLRIAHIVNPVKVGESSDLFCAQAITFETMRIAREFASSEVDVELFSVQYPEDHEIIPAFFRKLPDLQRSVMDIGSFSNKRKLPLIRDILFSLFDSTDSEYLIYTNADIALMPQFYIAIKSLISSGLDGFIVNKRRVSREFKRVSDIPLMWSAIGGSHPGFDCFVFHRSLFPKFALGNICIGVPFLEATLAHNLFALSSNFKLFTDMHLTIHIGMEVMPERDMEYQSFNHKEFSKIYKELKPMLSPDKLPYAMLPLHRKVIKWGLNPAVFILPNLNIEVSGWWNKFKYALNEIRWRWLAK